MAGLPSVMLRKKEQLENAESTNTNVVLPSLDTIPSQVGTANIEPLSEQDISAVAVETPQPTESVVVIQEPVKTKTIDQVENDYKSLKGQFDATHRENKDLRRDYVDLKQRYEALEARVAELGKAPVQPELNDDDLKLTDEETEQYGSAMPFLTKLFAARERQVERTIVKPLQEKLAALEAGNRGVVEKMTAADEGAFLRQVRDRVKGFDSIVASPAWATYQGQPISPYSSVTVGQVLMHEGHERRNLGLIEKIFSDFADKNKPSQVAAAYAAPSLSAASAPVPQSNAKPTLKLSERKKIHDQFKKGQITFERYKQFSDLYNEADKEGRVDYDK